MNEQELLSKINIAFSNAAPNVLDSVRSQCQEQKGTVIPLKQPEKKKTVWKRFASMAAALILVAGLGFGIGAYHSGHAVASTVSLDVNPSIEIKVNKNEKVLEVTPLNEDAQIVVGTMDFRGSNLDVTVNALIGSMLRNGYLNELANSILVSVDDSNTQRGKLLEERLASEINTLLHTDTFDGSVLSQTIAADAQLQEVAAQYGVTPGKASLIQQIVAQNPNYTFDSLAGLSINELNLISESGTLQLEQITTTGSASDKGYVGRDGAKAAALAYAKLKEEDLLQLECELDFEGGCLVYELEFHTANGEYDCHVNALTGEVLSLHHDDDHRDDHHNDHHSSAPPQAPAVSESPASSVIGTDAAKAAALAHAGIARADSYDWECGLDRDDGRTVYEIEFKSGRYEFSYEIDAYTGAVLKSEKDWDD